MSLIMNDNTEPLVTVAIIAYKASEYIEETLNSVKAQTYKNLELIISDDASPDDTVHICQRWLEINKDRFKSVKLLTVKTNTGVAGNCKRAIDASSGYYYKGMGSDDLLFPDCVENFVHFFLKHPDVKFSFAKEVRFNGPFSDHNFEYCKFPYRALCFRDSVTASDQLRVLTKNFIGCAPTMFVETELLKAVGIDDKYSTEDGPLFIRMTKAGIKLNYMDEFVIYRRIHPHSISHKKDDNALVKDIYVTNKKRWTELQYEYASPIWQKFHRYSNWLYDKVISTGNDKRSIKCRFYDFLRRWINPFKWNMIWMMAKDFVLTKLGY